MSRNNTISVCADGGIRIRNPGGFGYGSFAVGETLVERREYGHENDGHPMTNIVSEILTCTASLRWIVLHVSDPKSYRVEVINDCKWVCGHLGSPHSRSKKPHLKALHDQWKAVVRLFGSVEIRWRGREYAVALLGH